MKIMMVRRESNDAETIEEGELTREHANAVVNGRVQFVKFEDNHFWILKRCELKLSPISVRSSVKMMWHDVEDELAPRRVSCSTHGNAGV